jgi:hypothetical protein
MSYPSDSLFPSDTTYPNEVFVLVDNSATTVSSDTFSGNSVLNEEFNDSWGTWENYDSYDPAIRAILRDQRHIDIRNFHIADIPAPLNVLELSAFDMTYLSGQTMTHIEGLTHATKVGEGWSAGTNISHAGHNHWELLSLPIISGANDTSSIINPINLEDGFEDDDYVSLTPPGLSPESG